jgi:acetyl-CoA carboxylase biotin carboxyl carrier protein
VAQGREKTADPSDVAGDVASAGRAETGSDVAAAGGHREVRGESPGGDVKQGAGSQAWADMDFLKGLIEVVDASGIDSLEITRSGTRIKISKTPPAALGTAYYAPAPYAAQLPPSGSGPAGPAGAGPAGAAAAGGGGGGGAAAGGSTTAADAAAADAAAGEAAGLVDVKSPMVGTFYRAPAPEAPPYVDLGTRVSKGQTLCILEAMKLMNELESEVEGVVRQVLVENAEPVEYGQVLFRIDPNG